MTLAKRRRKRPTHGFSLIEIVIVLFLAGIMLFCVSGLTSQTFKTIRFLQEKSTTLESATLACERLASELREAVDTPSIGSTVSFEKVLPSAAYGVGNLASDPPTGWNRTYPASERAQITYTQSADKVQRQVNSEPSLDVAVDVNTFLVSDAPNSPPGCYLIQLTIVEDRRFVTFETYAVCPGAMP